MGKVRGGMKCVKYLLFVFNFIFWLSGLLVLGVGLWLRLDPDTVQLLTGDGAPETFFIAVYILIGAGGLIMVVGFFGCFGAIRESQCLLASFFACLLIVFGATVAAGVFGFLNKDQIVEEVHKFYSSVISDTSNSNSTTLASMYHSVLNCCGGSSPNPDLCSEFDEDTENCLTAITDFFNEKLHLIGFVGISIAGMMIMGLIFSMVLCCAIRNSREII